MKILISAFEPFGGEERNASLEVLRQINVPAGREIKKIVVPTVFGLAGKVLLDAVREERPDVVLCLGQAAGRIDVTPERVAINVRDASIPDNAGRQPKDEPIVPNGPAAIFSSLPIKDMIRAARNEGLSASISNSAGTFVCNDLMYSLLYVLNRDYPFIRGGFIHVPVCPSMGKEPRTPSMPTEMSAATIEAMFTAL